MAQLNVKKQGPATLAQKAQKWFDTFKDWNWEANKPSPQTGKLYPSSGKFHNGKTSLRISEMFDGMKVKPEWVEDFKNTIVAWCNDLAEKVHPNLNRMKDLAGIEQDINASNKEVYRNALNSINNTYLPSQPVSVAVTTPKSPTYAQFVAPQQSVPSS